MPGLNNLAVVLQLPPAPGEQMKGKRAEGAYDQGTLPSPVKLHCSLRAEDAIKASLANLQTETRTQEKKKRIQERGGGEEMEMSPLGSFQQDNQRLAHLRCSHPMQSLEISKTLPTLQ